MIFLKNLVFSDPWKSVLSLSKYPIFQCHPRAAFFFRLRRLARTPIKLNINLDAYSQKSEAISIRLPSGSLTMAERIFQGSFRGP